MDVDYRSLYVEDYFGHQDGAASFPAHFPEAFAAILRDVGAGVVLDVGAGNNELIRRLKPFGVDGLSIDLRADEARSVLAFDLTDSDPAQCRAVQERLERGDIAAPHVTCCLDVLEHLDRKDMAAAIWNLRRLAGEWLLVSVSTRPSSRYNLYHATIMPKRSWRTLLAAAGFAVTDHPRLADLASYRDYPQDEACWSVNQWRRVDPFRDARDPESYYLLLRRTDQDVDPAAFRAVAAKVLGREPQASRPCPTLRPDTHLIFLMGHYQDFLHFVPFWDALPRDAFTVLAVPDVFGVIGPRREKAMGAWMQSRGIRVERADTLTGFDWRRLPHGRSALVAASEATVSASHMLHSAFVLDARMRGLPTFQIQHGIWPHASFSTPSRSVSEQRLAWSAEFQEGFGGASPDPSLVTGCAKFDDYADARPLDLADLLGEWVEPFRRKVLVATNLHWPEHHRGAEFMPQLEKTAREMPDTLFVCKLHPVHDLEETPREPLPKNLLILDEFACLFAGLKTSQLVRACDAVVCTQSTVALEAALANRPFFVVDTDNPNSYKGVVPIPIASLTDAVREMLENPTLDGNTAFRDHYYDVANVGKSLERILATVEETIDAGVAPPPDVSAETLRSFTTTFAEYVLTVQPGRIGVLEEQLKTTRDLAAKLASRLQESEQGLAAANAAIGAMEQQTRDAASLQIRLDDAHGTERSLRDQLLPFEGLGPSSVQLAKRARRLSQTFPRLLAIYKAIYR